MLEQHARKLLRRAGLDGEPLLEPLPGGSNNRVFRVEVGGSRFLLKSYFHSAADPRDRLAAEFGFAKFSWEHGLRCLPRPLAADSGDRCALYEYLEGRKLEPGEIDASRVSQALDFWEALNDHRASDDAADLPIASEAFFSWAGHLGCVSRRLEALSRLEGGSPTDREAEAFVLDELRPTWERICKRIERGEAAAGRALHEELAPAVRRLSPSDFGFHNALLTADRGLCFFDFEYAGWDDVAKTVCDFFCQEAIPVPAEHLGMVTERVVAGAADPDAGRVRIRRFLPVCQVKWCCIYLNEFQAEPWRRRRFAGRAGGEREERKRTQLAKAQRMLAGARNSLEEHLS